MAAPPPPPPNATLFDMINNNQSLQTVLANTRQRLGQLAAQVTPPGTVEETDLDTEMLQGLVLTNLNGMTELQEQRVNVEYLKTTDRLQLPAALNLNPTTTNTTPYGSYSILVQRYWKVANMPYHEVKALAANLTIYAGVRTAIDARTGDAGNQLHAPFLLGQSFDLPDGPPDTEEVACVVYGTISRALGFNCDLRDTGMLTLLAMRMSDNYWETLESPPLSRLASKLHAYTLQSMVALNLPAVSNCHLAAWIRAHAVSAGVLPSVTSLCVKEYDYVPTMATKVAIQSVYAWEAQQQYDIRSVSMNLVAMFGLLHLAKDHTYKSNDPEMARICTSYLMTMRTMVPGDTMDYMKTHMEALCRTAQHPFGLAQTYAVAFIMGHHLRLSKPLQIRMNATPPPVQRLMIVKAATSEWKNVHVGAELNLLHAQELEVVNQEIDKVTTKPPHYSGLSRLYGHPIPLAISNESKLAADVMMPLIYGYAMSQHSDEQQKKDGIALALSLGNVSRDHGVLAQRFVVMWDNYMDKMEEEGLLKSAREARRNMVTPITAISGV